MKEQNLYFKKVFLLIFIFISLNSFSSFSQDIILNYRGEVFLNNANIINKKFDARLISTALDKKFKPNIKPYSKYKNLYKLKYHFKRKKITLHGKSKNINESSNCYFIIFDLKKNKNMKFKLFYENLNSEFHLDSIYKNQHIRKHILNNDHKRIANDKKTYLIINWNRFSIYLVFDSKSKLLSAIYIKMHDRILKRIYNF